MELYERNEFLERLKSAFARVQMGKGMNAFICGEAGIGKTALVREFTITLESPHLLLEGYCDPLYSARPLGPVYDVAPGFDEVLYGLLRDNAPRTNIFSRFMEAIELQTKPVVLWFEDIHWADESTLDFIRFLARRIHKLPCLFILTIRENELPPGHAFRLIHGEVSPGHSLKITLPPLSRSTVDALAKQAGREGDEVYKLTGGIPYYVSEVLESYNLGVPESVRDSILSVYHRKFDATKELWEIISVIPGRIELEVLTKIQARFSRVVDFCFKAGILVQDSQNISFKHELFRTTIEESLAPMRRKELHKLVMQAMIEVEHIHIASARIMHHARLAGDADTIRKLAHLAAAEAAALGSHIEALKLYRLALKYTAPGETARLADLSEKYAYECYLTNRVSEGIEVLEAIEELLGKEQRKEIGRAICLKSRLYWFGGDTKTALNTGKKAIEILEDFPDSKELALAYSNLSQLKMELTDFEECLFWGQKAIKSGKRLNDPEVLSHAYINVGTLLMLKPGTRIEGEEKLLKGIDLAKDNDLHGIASRGLSNLSTFTVLLGDNEAADKRLKNGLEYSEEYDITSCNFFMQSWDTCLKLRTGQWDRAKAQCEKLLQDPSQQPIVTLTVKSVLATIRMRRGDENAIRLLREAAVQAGRIGEIQRMLPVMSALLEYEWLYEAESDFTEFFQQCFEKLVQLNNLEVSSECLYWLLKVRGKGYYNEVKKAFDLSGTEETLAHMLLESVSNGNSYLEAILLFEGDAEDQRKAMAMLLDLDASQTVLRIRKELQDAGVERVPKGPRLSTQKNPAGLTNRQMEVLKLIAEGMKNKEIAQELFISAKTVDHHISAVLTKLDVHSRTGAVAKASEIGILEI